MIKKSTLIEKSVAFFKTKNFKKKRHTWLYETEDTIACYNIQTSQWDSEDYYINIGIVIKGIDFPPDVRYGAWHLSRRIFLEDKTYEEILTECFDWLTRFSNMENLIDCFETYSKQSYKNRLPLIFRDDAIEFMEKRSQI